MRKKERKRTHPSILTKHPRGTTNFTTVSGTPLALQHLNVTGKVAALLAVPQAVIQAGEFLNQKDQGFFLTKAK